MPTGIIKWFNPKKGYGFVTPEDGSKDAFVHITAVQGAGLDTLNEGDKIEYELDWNNPVLVGRGDEKGGAPDDAAVHALPVGAAIHHVHGPGHHHR